jgi:hypothetical protein
MSSLAAATEFSGDSAPLALVILVLSAFVGYRMSVRHYAQRGVTPWRFPSIVWGLICLAIGPLGLLMELFAGVTTRPGSMRAPGLGLRGARAAVPAPLDPELATAAPLAAPTPVVSGPMPPQGPDGTGPAPFGWYADVTRRHEYRYFDGKYWGAQVADGGVVSEDPL